jgi:hypothetical protein
MHKDWGMKINRYILHQVIHECLQGNIVGEDGLRRHTATVSTGSVGG